MTAILLILLASVTQALSVNAIRDIQANSINIYRAVVWNYVACLCLGVIYIAFTGIDENWLKAVPYGVFTGFFYIVALITMIRSMRQRGLAITIAIANVSMVMPVIIAIMSGDSPSLMQLTGIALAAVAIPILSLSTATGRAIRESPSFKLAVFLFIVRGLAACGNLVAEDRLPPSILPVYVTSLFGSCLVFGLISLLFVEKKSGFEDIKLGVTFGVLNIAATSTLLFALTRVSESIVFAAYNVLGISISVILALWLWRERIQYWGWIGFVIALLSTILMKIHEG